MNTFQIKQKIYDMMLYANNPLHNFPNYEKKALCREIRETMLTMYRYATDIEIDHSVKTALQMLDRENTVLKGLIRFAFEAQPLEARKKPFAVRTDGAPTDDAPDARPPRRGYISQHTYEVWAEKAVEIGKMIGGYKERMGYTRGRKAGDAGTPGQAAMNLEDAAR